MKIFNVYFTRIIIFIILCVTTTSFFAVQLNRKVKISNNFGDHFNEKAMIREHKDHQKQIESRQFGFPTGTELPLQRHQTLVQSYVPLDKNVVSEVNMHHNNNNGKHSQVVGKSAGTCEHGYFKLEGMNHCQKWLKCKDLLPMVNYSRMVGKGLAKRVYAIEWKEKSVKLALLVTRSRDNAWVVSRARNSLAHLIKLHPSRNIIQLVGHCSEGNNTIIVTEYCGKYGSLDKFIGTQKFQSLSARQRLKLSMQIIEGFVFLHYASGVPKVHCDLHNPNQALEQYLVTDDMRIVLGDIDEIPQYDLKRNSTPKCLSEQGCRMSDKDFLAPEQRYSQSYCIKHNRRQTATIKSDVWKIPSLSKQFLNENTDNSTLRKEIHVINSHLKDLHRKCKNTDPLKRPPSDVVLTQYYNLYKKLYG